MKKKDACEGFSLAELVMVILCAGIMVAAAVPNISHLQKVWMLWGGARTLESSLQWGRMYAICSNAPVLLAVDRARGEFHWLDPVSGDPFTGSIRQISSGLRIVGSPNRPLRFYPHGNAAPAGTFTIQGEAGSYSVIVSPGGRIRIRKN